MSETTHTSNLQLKLIGTGRESGTWGNSTNENLARLEAALGRTVSLDVTNMPISSTSATSGNSWVAEWITVNASDSLDGEAGSEGRCRVVEFTGTVSANTTVKIRGATTATIPARVMFVKNSLSGSYTLTLDADGTDYDIASGATALVVVVPTATGNFTKGVHGILGNMNGVSIATGKKVNFVGAGEIDFDGAGTITVPAATAAALTITDGSRNWIILDSVSSGGTGVVDVNASVLDVATQDTTVLVRDARSAALTFSDGTTSFLRFDSSANEVDILAPLDIDTATINSATQATTWTVIDNSASGLNFTEGSLSLLKLVSTTGSELLSTEVRVSAPDLLLTGGDAYINFNSTTGSSGYGFRNNTGVPQVKSNGGSWADISTSIAVIQAAFTAATAGAANSKGAFDIGPIRFIINTVNVGGGSELITLADGGDGTSTDMATTLWSVMACQAEDSSQARNIEAYVVNATGAFTKTFRLRATSSVVVTYIAIGDSGA